MSEYQLEKYKQFYEDWAKRREDPLEADYIFQIGKWKWEHLRPLIACHVTPESVLEFGCGSGEMLGMARASFPEARLYGIDLSETMVAMARARLGEATLVSGSDAELERWQPRVDLALAIDILEHLEDPVRVARALGRAGRYVALKIPIERRVIRLGIRKQKTGVEHLSGHIHFWTLGDSRRLLRAAGLRILEEEVADPPDELRAHPAMTRLEPRYARTPLGILRGAHHAMEVELERFSYRHSPRLHRWMFGSTHFVVAAIEDAGGAG
jgi:SAM-dependent methyltransferase